jgi:hypothetical protein
VLNTISPSCTSWTPSRACLPVHRRATRRGRRGEGYISDFSSLFLSFPSPPAPLSRRSVASRKFIQGRYMGQSSVKNTFHETRGRHAREERGAPPERCTHIACILLMCTVAPLSISEAVCRAPCERKRNNEASRMRVFRRRSCRGANKAFMLSDLYTVTLLPVNRVSVPARDKLRGKSSEFLLIGSSVSSRGDFAA